MVKFQHMMTAEESISSFIQYLETAELEYPLSESDKVWLLKRGKEVFDKYYIDDQPSITLTTDEDEESVKDFCGRIQIAMGNMFAHIMLLEFNTYLFVKYLQ